MELPQIKYFLAVCGTRNFTRAAAVCGISQPSLSAAIRRLEERLGGPLFERGPPLRVSPLGEAIKPHCEAILRAIEQIRRIGAGEFEGSAQPVNGQKRTVSATDDVSWITERNELEATQSHQPPRS